MLTRRDALKLAAGLAAAASVSSALTPTQAAAMLDAPLDPGVTHGRSHHTRTDVFDPVSFADELDGIDLEEMCRLIAPDDLAEYYQARREVLRALPILQDVRASHPWHRMDEAAMGLWCAAWMAGVRAGA